MTTEYHVVIACPEDWNEGQATQLAQRLADHEVPASVGVFVWKLEDGKLVEQTCLHDGREAIYDD